MKKIKDEFYDEFIVGILKKELEIKYDKINIIGDEKLNLITDKVKQKKQIIIWLFENNFSLIEYELERIIEMQEKKLDFYDEIANNVLKNRINKIFEELLEHSKKDGQYISVCLDRRIFINKILDKNIYLEDIKPYIKKDEVEREL